MFLTRRRKRIALWTLFSASITVIAVLLAYLLYDRPDSVLQTGDGPVEGITNIHARTEAEARDSFAFSECAAASGIHFQHFPYRRSSVIVEDMGSGLAWGDYDNDGDADLFLVNFSGPIIDHFSQENSPHAHALYQNQGDGTFIDVSAEVRINIPSYGMGAAWGDYDNDGDLDIYITNYGPNFLFRNNGDGSFSEISEQAGVNDGLFGSGCMWGDYNRDGWIDLYVCNYVDFVFREADRNRKTEFKRAVYPYTLNPSSYQPQPNRLYRNNGDGTFTDVAENLNVHNPEGRSLSAAWVDFDLDGNVDLYIANDVSSNALYRNKGVGAFEDISSSSLTADYRGAMGIAVGDFDRDSDFDMVITHWLAQENALYENMHSLMSSEKDADQLLFFTDVSDEFGLGQISLDMVGWSTSFVDFDNDGLLDLWVSNGNTLEDPNDSSQLLPQRFFLFRQRPDKGFIEIARSSCDYFAKPLVTRGGAYADVNNDGKMDIVIQQHGSSPLLFLNKTQNKNNWIQLELRQQSVNIFALGARVAVRTREGIQTQQVGSQGSYLSQNQTILHFGIGTESVIEEIIIHWPDGTVERIDQVNEVNKKITLIH
ncbi:MAG: CRTAC1 family protein [Candidatus Omnitrophota bacterium]